LLNYSVMSQYFQSKECLVDVRPDVSPSALHKFGGYSLTYDLNSSPIRSLAIEIYAFHTNILGQGKTDECVSKGRPGR
jgi:hypothetical protein